MDLRTVLAEVRGWTAQDQLRLIGELWDGLSDAEVEVALTEELRSWLDRRIEASDEKPDAVVPWDEVRNRALERFGK
ncbi:addiction module protein [Paludisphaera soli]|uniref:addiction module protein n=1 Tax=Paludisphaera soli TaxID=2712865 RepID=UPI0013ED9AFA|nr:addiction module protein [Paludisphaera soli]